MTKAAMQNLRNNHHTLVAQLINDHLAHGAFA
jgi:hypothetical protein